MEKKFRLNGSLPKVGVMERKQSIKTQTVLKQFGVLMEQKDQEQFILQQQQQDMIN